MRGCFVRVLICTASIVLAVTIVQPAYGSNESVPPTASKLVDRGDKLERKGDHKGAIAAYDEAR